VSSKRAKPALRDVAKRLLAARRRAELTQAEVADKLKISPSAYGKYEAAEVQIPSDKLKLLAGLFGMATDAILGNHNNHENDVMPFVTTQCRKQIFNDLDAIKELDPNYEKMVAAQIRAYRDAILIRAEMSTGVQAGNVTSTSSSVSTLRRFIKP
jgi:transcriptional regulator with XRE-family HTH domain